MRKILMGFLLALCAAMFCIGAGYMIGISGEYRRGAQAYDALDVQFVAQMPTVSHVSEDADSSQQNIPLAVDFDALRMQFPDAVAWLYCPDTVISYPVMHADDNETYLYALPDGTSNRAGSLFLECQNRADFSDGNSVIYGHNMKNGTMFGTLTKYAQQSYYDAHPYLFLFTPDASYRIELIAGFVTDVDSPVYTLANVPEQCAELLRIVAAQSDFVSDVLPANDERLITLSTCSYEFDDARYVLVGVLRPFV